MKGSKVVGFCPKNSADDILMTGRKGREEMGREGKRGGKRRKGGGGKRRERERRRDKRRNEKRRKKKRREQKRWKERGNG